MVPRALSIILFICQTSSNEKEGIRPCIHGGYQVDVLRTKSWADEEKASLHLQIVALIGKAEKAGELGRRKCEKGEKGNSH